MALSDIRRQGLMDLFKKEPRTIRDIASMTGVNYVTASRWLKELREDGRLVEMPFPRGKETMWTMSVRPPGAEDDNVLIVQVGKHLATVAQVATSSSSDPYAYFTACLAFLYRKSHNRARGEGIQGPWTPVEIRQQMRDAREALMSQLKVVEQVLLLDDVFIEDGTAHQLMGPMETNKLAQIDDWAKPVDTRYARENLSGGQ